MFKDKVVLITGASRGIGRASAIEFAKLGAMVVINYKSNKKAAEEVALEIAKFGGKATCVKTDISNYDEIKKLANYVEKTFGKLDVLVNNAGILYDREFEEIKYEESLNIVKTNMLAPLFLSQELAPLMIKTGNSKIINVTSTSGMHDLNPGIADYAMSKAALVSLTKNLSMKYAPKIRVNAVAPGWVNTDMNKDLPKELIDSETAKYHMKRWAQPEEIADAIIYLASDKANYITGQVLVIDGGHC